MDEQKEGAAKKPFYEDIVSKKKRTEGRRMGKDDHKGPSGKGAEKSGASGESGALHKAVSPDAPRAPRAPGSDRPSRGDDHRSGGSDHRREGDDSFSRPRAGGKPSSGARPGAYRGVRTDHGDRPDRGERTDRGARTAPGVHADRGERTDRGARTAPGVHADRGYRGDHGDRPTRGSASSDARSGATTRTSRRPFSAPKERDPVFKKLLPETRALLESFPEIVQSVMPLDSKRLQELPNEIRELSHGLTDERGDRRVGYMNEPAVISAYVRYYLWWNLVRLTRIFAGLPLTLSDGDAVVDLGSGPLTLPIALWMARPDLRAVKLTWYCVDLSQGALAAGEELFLSLAARTGDEPWQIVRIKGECGVSLRRRVALVASANMFNELFWDNPAPIEQQVKHHAQDLVSYADRESSILIVEPGIPRAGRFISLMRDAFIREGFSIQAPCPHEGVCPFPGLRTGKWCHFVFDTSDAPAKLHKLSDDAGLSKDRAALSFVFASRTKEVKAEVAADEIPVEGLTAESISVPSEPVVSAESVVPAEPVVPAVVAGPVEAPLSMLSRMSSLFPDLSVRITSDPIKLPDYYTGRYGCSELGMVMLMGTYQAADYLMGCHSGSLVEVPMPDRKRPERDGKTGAIIIRLK